MSFRRLTWKSEQIDLKAKLYTPSPSSCRGFVIFTHGLGYCARQYKIDTDYFVKNGYAIVTYDLRAHAGTKGVWTLDGSVNDLVRLIDFLEINNFLDSQKSICVMGHSTGALISILAAMKDPRVDCASLITIVTCLLDSFKYWFESGYNQAVKEFFKSKGILPEIINRFMDDVSLLELYKDKKIKISELSVPHRYGMLKSGDWGEFFHQIAYSVNIMDFLKEIKIPVILFRGAEDEVMDPSKTDVMYEALKANPFVRRVITSSRDHFQNDNWPLIQIETVNFLESVFNYKQQSIKKI